MGFMNIHDVLITDNEENIYSFYTYEKKIKMIFYDRKSGRADKKLIVNDCLDEYDATISKDGTIYLVSQKIDGSIVLVTIDGSRQEENILAEEFESKLKNLNIRVIKDQIHIIYCLESNEGNNKYRIYHHSLLGDEWDTHIISDISIRDILNPISVVELGDKLIIGYYDILNNCEQIYISKYDLTNFSWSDKIQLTTDNSMKLYLDMISYNENEIDLCYSKLVEGNFVVAHEKHNISYEKTTRIAEHILSNPSNCTYPTLIYSEKTLWTIWMEYNGLLSCFSDDGGLSWSLPYYWENSKKDDFARYRFSTNNDSIVNEYIFNFGFGTYGDEMSFIGFGDIEKATEVPLKSQIKKKDIDEDVGNIEVEDLSETDIISGKEVIGIKDNNQIDNEIKDLKERILYLEENLKNNIESLENKLSETNIETHKLPDELEKIADIDKRLSDVENYLNRRRRGFIR